MAAAVSGGADSVALLGLLLELRAELGIVLSIAHVNHKLRGEESDEDERFVAELARLHGLALHVRAAPVGERQSCGGSSSAGSGIEAAARALRYGFFRELTRDGRVAKVATAHTLDDQAETVLLRIFRGTGIRGLSGIHPRIIFEDHERAFGEVLRPLLGFRRAALQDFLRAQSQGWREDSSNREIAFLRNRVRHRLLPMIAEEFGDSAIGHMGELAEIARAEEEQWAAAAWPADAQYPVLSQHAGLNVERLRALPLAAQRRLVRAWLQANAPDLGISFRLIEEALELAGEPADGNVEAGSGWNLRLGRRELLLEREPSSDRNGKVRDKVTDYQYALPIPGAVCVPELGARRIEAQIVEAVAVPEDERGQLLDRTRLPGEVLIRNWRAGDRYWPAHTAAAKKVKELLSDRHATGLEKKLWPVAVADGCGLVWLRGFAVPAALRAPAEAKHAIWIREIAGMM